MNIGKTLKKWLRMARYVPRILMRYGTLNPEVVRIPHAVGRFHINPHDGRARRKLIFDAIRNRYSINRRFWNDFIAAVRPDLALDIGTNYGECIFSPGYPGNTTAIAFEANPELVGYLEKSRRDHPSMNQIEVINALVGKEPSGQRDFYINETQSGRSTAVAAITENSASHRIIKVDTVSVDSCVNDRNITAGSVVFKIDVEGYEPHVLLGMKNTIGKAKTAVGFVEYDTGYLHKSGWTAQQYQEQALDGFDLYVPIKQGLQKFTRIESLSDYSEQASKHLKRGRDLHFDLILVKKGSDTAVLPDNWELS